MSMFGFDEQYAYYGVTPVDNQFILEYLPNATGDAVRVYLYGLMQCYHPQQAMTIAQMARELDMEEDTIRAIYRYWERKGLVRRVSDAPEYKYVSIKQLTMTGNVIGIDSEYERFSTKITALFGYDRELHGKDREKIFEWVDQLNLPMDVVIYLIEFMIKWRGKKVGIETIEKRAMRLSDERVESVEDAERVLSREQSVWNGCRAVIKRLERTSRYPSKDEEILYHKWHVEWKFSHEDILAACAETVKGKPNFGYLDGIIKRLYVERKNTDVKSTIRREQEENEPLKELLKVLNLQNVSVNVGTKAVYEDMRALYPDNIIKLAGEECAKRGGSFSDVMDTLEEWKNNRLTSVEEIAGYVRQKNQYNKFLRMLYEAMGVTVKPNAADRKLAKKWLQEYAFDMEFVIGCAAWAVGKEKPMLYLDAVLSNYREKNITTLEEATRERAAHQQAQAKQPAQQNAPARGPKTVEQQNYTQREYTHTEDAMDAMMRKWQEENGDA